jgi:putative inorganic carbon (hco3(-)) transporter
MAGKDNILKEKKIIIPAVITIAFFIAGMIAESRGISILWILPVAVFLLIFTLLSIEKAFVLILFMVPLSLQWSFISETVPFDISIPTEPLLALILFIVIFRLIVTREFSTDLLKHPVTIIIAFYLLWTLITSVLSGMPLVSFKALAYRMWFIASFYLLAARIFLQRENYETYIVAYSLGLALVVTYFFAQTAAAGFLNQKLAHSACFPFYKDHTSFGAALSFCIPPLFVMAFKKKRGFMLRLMYFLLGFFFMAGLVFSYSRAAWVSLLVSSGFSLILALRLHPKILAAISAVLLIGVVLSAGTIWEHMDSTREDSSTDMKTHLESSSNISTDQSNLERINRWKSAIRMFYVKPVTGWGPGTYQFYYAPYQYSKDRTIISTDFGDAGNSHSEYLGPLSETGLPGALIFVLIIVTAMVTGMKVWYKNKRNYHGYFSLAIIAGFMTYVIHGIMNSFLDTDKIASLFWGYIAMMTSMSILIKRREGKISGTN